MGSEKWFRNLGSYKEIVKNTRENFDNFADRCRSEIWKLVEKISNLTSEERLDENYYRLLLDFWKLVANYWKNISYWDTNEEVREILENSHFDEILAELENEQVSLDTYPDLVERLWVEIAILESKKWFNLFILSQDINILKRWYDTMLWVDIQDLWNKMIRVVNILIEINERLKQKNEQLNIEMKK